MIPPKLKDIFTTLPELSENHKLLDWYNLFGAIDFDKLLKEGKFTMDIGKVIRKTELKKGFH